MSWTRLCRFLPKGSNQPRIGEPVDATLDIGLSIFNKRPVRVKAFSGASILSPGNPSEDVLEVDVLLSPLATEEVGTIRCIGLNYLKHAEEAGLPVPKEIHVFYKPDTSLSGPFPDPIVVPKAMLKDDAADYESELAIILGKTCKDVSEAEALDYVHSYTAANDVSSRKAQFAQSQWCYSKSFDKACPIGPCVVSAKTIPDPSNFMLKGFRNEKLVQESGLNDLIFSIPKIISFLSQGTTLKPGTLILTGTPFGVASFAKEPHYLQDNETFRVQIEPHIGSLINKVQFER